MMIIEDVNTILLYIFVILLLFCIMYIVFYSDQNIQFYDNLDILDSSIYKHNNKIVNKATTFNKDNKDNIDNKFSKEKFETLTVNDITYYIFNPPESSRKVSDHFGQTSATGSYPGDDFKSSMLDTLQGWSPKNKSISPINSKWIQMDLGSVINIAGVVTQARGPGLSKKLTNTDARSFIGESVTKYKVIYSIDENTWNLVDNGKLFFGNTREKPAEYISAYQNNTKIGNIFSKPISARYIRIIPQEFIRYPSMRAGLLVSNDVILINNTPYIITEIDNSSQSNKTIQINNNTYNIINPPESSRQVSEHYDQTLANIDQSYPPDGYYDSINKPKAYTGYDHISSMLDSPQGWSTKDNLNITSKWLIIDLGLNMNVAGVITQGRGSGIGSTLNSPLNSFVNQSVTSYNVLYSQNNIDWLDVDNKKIFIANTNENPAVFYTASQQNTKIGNLFTRPISARYIMIIPQSYYNHITMRVGLLTIPNTITTIIPITTKAPENTQTIIPSLRSQQTPVSPQTTIQTPLTTQDLTKQLPTAYYSDTDGKAYLQSLSDFNTYIVNNQNNLTNILITIQNAKEKTSTNNTVLMNSITNLYYKQYLESINNINAAVYNQSNKSMNPKIQKIKDI
jgi:hypothetical protein